MGVLCKVRTGLISSNIPVTCGSTRHGLARSACIMFSIRAANLSTMCSAVVRLTTIGVRSNRVVSQFRSFTGPRRPLSTAAVGLAKVASSLIRGTPRIRRMLGGFRR